MRWCSYLHGRAGLLTHIQYAYHMFWFHRMGAKLGITIGPDVFGYGLLIPHSGTIVVNADCVAGNYCVLHTSTCIGQKRKRIGDGLFLSSGAKILRENIEIGNYVSVAPNSLVLSDFKSNNVLLAGCPAVEKKQIKPWFKNTKYEERIRQIEELRAKMNL